MVVVVVEAKVLIGVVTVVAYYRDRQRPHHHDHYCEEPGVLVVRCSGSDGEGGGGVYVLYCYYTCQSY